MKHLHDTMRFHVAVSASAPPSYNESQFRLNRVKSATGVLLSDCYSGTPDGIRRSLAMTVYRLNEYIVAADLYKHRDWTSFEKNLHTSPPPAAVLSTALAMDAMSAIQLISTAMKEIGKNNSAEFLECRASLVDACCARLYAAFYAIAANENIDIGRDQLIVAANNNRRLDTTMEAALQTQAHYADLGVLTRVVEFSHSSDGMAASSCYCNRVTESGIGFDGLDYVEGQLVNAKTYVAPEWD